jgi:hypothetical protein
MWPNSLSRVRACRCFLKFMLGRQLLSLGRSRLLTCRWRSLRGLCQVVEGWGAVEGICHGMKMMLRLSSITVMTTGWCRVGWHLNDLRLQKVFFVPICIAIVKRYYFLGWRICPALSHAELIIKRFEILSLNLIRKFIDHRFLFRRLIPRLSWVDLKIYQVAIIHLNFMVANPRNLRLGCLLENGHFRHWSLRR